MKIVVLGAGGQLGQTLVLHARATHDVHAYTRQQLDIAAPGALATTLSAIRPDVVLNAAAFAMVDEAEDAPEAAFAANAWALRDLAELSRTLSFTLVHYGTDFVFDGIAPGPHHEDDATNPRGVYATSKLIGEWFALESPQAYVLRVESLFGGQRAKSSVDVMLRALLDGREVRAFDDRSVSPSFVEDVAAATFGLIETRAPFGVYHVVNSERTTWVGIAAELARLLQVANPLITPVKMAGLSLKVPRPLNAALSNEKLLGAGVPMPTWQNALARYVASVAAP